MENICFPIPNKEVFKEVFVTKVIKEKGIAYIKMKILRPVFYRVFFYWSALKND